MPLQKLLCEVRFYLLCEALHQRSILLLLLREEPHQRSIMLILLREAPHQRSYELLLLGETLVHRNLHGPPDAALFICAGCRPRSNPEVRCLPARRQEPLAVQAGAEGADDTRPLAHEKRSRLLLVSIVI